MPPILALVVCGLFVAYTMRSSAVRSHLAVSRALWIPTVWVVLIGSRPVSFWFSPSGRMGIVAGTLEDGSPVDRAVYTVLILLGVWVVSSRRLAWNVLLARNSWLVAFLAYALVSTLWSDFPYVAFKRYIKLVGMIVMALVILTESHPVDAILTLMRRSAYLMLPVSLLLIKYYPHLGVLYTDWGARMVTGMALDKNMLGQLCLVFAVIFAWTLLPQLKRGIVDRKQFVLDAFHLALAVHLLRLADSANSLACLVAAVAVLHLSDLPAVRLRLGPVVAMVTGGFMILDWVANLSEAITALLGRDPTWTNRSQIWAELVAMNSNWALGAGFDTFWMGDRLQMIRESRHITEAHNGYLEIILNLGIVGLLLFIPVILSAYANCRRHLAVRSAYGSLAISVLAMILLYNVAESGFKGLSLVLFMFLLVATAASAPAEALAATKLRRPGMEHGRSGVRQPRSLKAG
jgi:exopolysaccharide production protein ExoQ